MTAPNQMTVFGQKMSAIGHSRDPMRNVRKAVAMRGPTPLPRPIEIADPIWNSPANQLEGWLDAPQSENDINSASLPA